MVHSLEQGQVRSIYEMMKRIRCVEEKIASLYPEGKMRCPTHLSIGQEAVPAVMSLHVKDSDYAVSTHRGHAHYISKGGCLKKMIAELYGKETGCSKGKGGSMHLTAPDVNFIGTTAIVGGSIPLGVGAGLHAKLMGIDAVSIIYLGEGATEEGVFYESANFCALKELPVVFICENNLYSVYTGLQERQPRNRNLCSMVHEIGIRATRTKGHELSELNSVVKHAIDVARQEGKPSFIEVETYRWREHCGPNFDNDIGYRSEAEFQAWKSIDPLDNLENKMLAEIGGADYVQNVIDEINLEIAEAFEFAEASEFPNINERELGVFAGC